MSQRVKIKVRARQSVQFPGVCVHCARPASSWLGLRRRIGRVTRLIDVPLCAACQDQLRRQSGEEERLGKLGRLSAILALFLVLAAALLLTPAAMLVQLRLLIALLLSLSAAQVVVLLFRRSRREAALPEKKEIYRSANIVDFSWRATTFEFANETFAERFKRLNEPLLMDS